MFKRLINAIPSFCNAVMYIMAGAFCSSMWITHSDRWKCYLSVWILAATIKTLFKDEHN